MSINFQSNPSLEKKILFWLLPLLLLAVYWPSLHLHPTLKFDDESLLEPLAKIESIQHYFEMIKNNKILDIQPVRDLSFWLELKVEEKLGFRNSQAINLVLWLLTLLYVFKILELLNPKSRWNGLILLLLAVNPILASTIAWTAARKHLLSAFFVIIASFLVLKNKQGLSFLNIMLIAVLFLLSCLSQPINVGWPIWLGFLFLFRSHFQFSKGPKSQWLLVLLLFLLCALIVAINIYYYAGSRYLENAGESAPKLNEESLQNIYARFLVWGRFTFQLLLPIKPSPVPYHLTSWPSFVGLLLFGGAIATLIQRKQQSDWLWFLFILLPISVMTAKLTHHGGWDTYLFIPVIGVYILLASILSNLEISKKIFAYMGAIILILSAITYRQSLAWSNDLQLWTTAYQSEKTPFALSNYAKNLILTSQFAKAFDVTLEIKEDYPELPDLAYLEGRLIYEMPKNPQEKKKIFQENMKEHPWYQYYWAVFHAKNNDFEQANQILSNSYQKDPLRFKKAIFGYEQEVLSRWMLICAQAANSNCGIAKSAETALQSNK